MTDAAFRARDLTPFSGVEESVTDQQNPVRRGTAILFTGAFLGGAMTTLGLLNEMPGIGIVGVALTLAFIVLFSRRPLVLAGLGTGVVLTVAALAVVWVTGGWSCAGEVEGRLIEHSCESGPVAEAP